MCWQSRIFQRFDWSNLQSSHERVHLKTLYIKRVPATRMQRGVRDTLGIQRDLFPMPHWPKRGRNRYTGIACPAALGFGACGGSIDCGAKAALLARGELRVGVLRGLRIHEVGCRPGNLPPCSIGNGWIDLSVFKCKELSTHRGSPRRARHTKPTCSCVEHSLRLWEVLGLGEVIQGV